MPRHCSAAGCKSRDTRETRKAGITFHRLPKRGSPRRTLWIINSQRTGPQGKGQWDPQSHFIYFCSKHFTPESFELSGVSGYRRLKEDAVPTVFETFSRQRRGTSAKAQRGRDRPGPTTRQTRRRACSLKKEQDGSDTCQDSQQGAEGCHNAGNTVSGKEDGKEEGLRLAGGAKRGAQTTPPTQSPVSSSPSHPSCETSQFPPPSPSASAVVPSSSQTPQPLGPQLSEMPPSPSSCSPPRPPSPSRYMRRLPPPPGFYLPKEHNYAQLCPLVWRKRYDRAIDSLEKSLRLLNAARRRENRLRQTLLRLRESRLKHTLGRFREGTKGREGRWGRGRMGQGSRATEGELAERGTQHGLEESEAERMAEDLSMIEDGLGGAGEWSGPTQSARTSFEDEMGYCFYCGRGREDEGTEEQSGGSHQRGKEGEEQREDASLCYYGAKREERERGRSSQTIQRAEEVGVEAGTEECCYYYYCDNGEGETREGEDGVQIVTVELAAPGQTAAQPQKLIQPLAAMQTLPFKASASPVLHSAQLQPIPLQQQLEQQAEVHLPTHTATGALHTTLQTLQPAQLQPVQLLQQGPGPQHGPLIVDSGGEAESVIREGEEEQQVFWLQEGMEGRLLLIPVPIDDRVRNITRKDGGASDPGFQPIVVSAVGFQTSPTKEPEQQCLETGGTELRTAGQTEKECSLQSETRIGVGGGDVRERLKEHLEGFQLQLSSEFIN
ncbi:THAP domain-containing protein 7 [Megalops cyprinoides]|uniref:THAP domain-containing protein 7 n=1 Tax=Megalops cyprinoides TaxID=118141 RepID=UPI001863AADC|nr:THAP domain-containing protein 7 [Megalops cyprinoides]